MTHEMEYQFDDLQIMPGCNIVASGIADAKFKLEPPDPDSGWPRWTVYDLELTSISLDPLALGESGKTLDQKDPVYKLIETALFNDDNLIGEALQCYQSLF